MATSADAKSIKDLSKITLDASNSSASSGAMTLPPETLGTTGTVASMVTTSTTTAVAASVNTAAAPVSASSTNTSSNTALIFSASHVPNAKQKKDEVATASLPVIAHRVWDSEFDKLRTKKLLGSVFIMLRNTTPPEDEHLPIHQQRTIQTGVTFFYENGNVQMSIKDFDEFLDACSDRHYTRGGHDQYGNPNYQPKYPIVTSQSALVQPDVPLTLTEFDKARKHFLTGKIQLKKFGTNDLIVSIDYKSNDRVIIPENDFNKFLDLYIDYHYDLGRVKYANTPWRPRITVGV